MRYINDEELRNRLGEAGKQYVLDRFSPESLVSDIESVYEQVCCRRSAA
jgi:glycosyltransferase involved in cell wall biosynthesis